MFGLDRRGARVQNGHTIVHRRGTFTKSNSDDVLLHGYSFIYKTSGAYRVRPGRIPVASHVSFTDLELSLQVSIVSVLDGQADGLIPLTAFLLLITLNTYR